MKGRELIYYIFQMKEEFFAHDGLMFLDLKELRARGKKVDGRDYKLIYTSRCNSGEDTKEVLEKVYARFNVNIPDIFQGHSMSVSDVIVVLENRTYTAYFVDRFGFTQIPEFFEDGYVERILQMDGRDFIVDEEDNIHLPEASYLEFGQFTYCTVRQKCMHVLGLDHYPHYPQVYHRHGKKYCKTYRNYYGAHETAFDPLILRGLMSGTPSDEEPEKGNYWFHFTDSGIEWMAKELGFQEIKIK